ncbi:MAG: hypothetical protein KAU26_00255 [Methylococcales bacterium]|nr:hypothetical protein [Methylococcales bacterium]
MRLIILPLLIASVGIAEAGVYKCPDPVTGKLTYQARPCHNQGNSNENKVRIMPEDEKRAKAAKEKLDLYMKNRKAKKETTTKSATPPPTEIKLTLPPSKTEPNPQETQGNQKTQDNQKTLAPSVNEANIPTIPTTLSPKVKPDNQPQSFEVESNIGS